MGMLPQGGWAPLFPAMQSAGAPQMQSMGAPFMPAMATAAGLPARAPGNTTAVQSAAIKSGPEKGEGADNPAWDWTAVLEGHAESRATSFTSREITNASSCWPSDDATTSLETSSDFEDRVDDLDFQLPTGARCADPLHEGEEMIDTLLQTRTIPETDEMSCVVLPGLQHQDANLPPADLCFVADSFATAAPANPSVPRGRAPPDKEPQDTPRLELDSGTQCKKRKALSLDTRRATNCPHSRKRGRVMAS
jgi:hypothetical protein